MGEPGSLVRRRLEGEFEIPTEPERVESAAIGGVDKRPQPRWNGNVGRKGGLRTQFDRHLQSLPFRF